MRAIGRALAILAALVLASCGLGGAPAYAQNVKTFVPKAAYALLPELRDAQRGLWPDAPIPSFLAAQVEQESCISLTHSRCWNPRAELKTSRENGIGLGQFTRAYSRDGSIRFDTIADLSRRYSELRGWSWANRYDGSYQLKALVLMDRGIYRRVADAATPVDRVAFTLSAYNGGESGVRQDRLLCDNTGGCDPGRWFGHVENHSLKARKPFKGYGQSPFRINRDYVRNVIEIRRPKYEPFFSNQ